MVRNRADNVRKWGMDELVAILLRQFKRLLTEKGIELTEADILTLAENAAAKVTGGEQMEAVRRVLVELVEESVNVLQTWGLSYEQALRTGMDDMSGWETTADFLELANQKVNAELRISAGASLLAGLGDARHADYLLQTFEHGMDDAEDVDAVIAKRALSFVSGIDENAPDWLAGARRWVIDR